MGVYLQKGKPVRQGCITAHGNGEESKLAYLTVRVHDLKHTFGHRLRAAGVSFEDRQDLLGIKASASLRITQHPTLIVYYRRLRKWLICGKSLR